MIENTEHKRDREWDTPPTWNLVDIENERIRKEDMELHQQITNSLYETPYEEIGKRLPLNYPMSLNKADMLNLLFIMENHCCDDDTDLWAVNMRHSILSTLGIEEI